MAKVDVPLDWVHTPQQARSQKTLEKLLDAAEALLLEGGLDAVTVPAVVQRARSSVGSFYARFPDKQALLATLHERACQQTIATADRALDPELWRGHTLDEILRAAVAFSVHIFGTRRSVMAAFQQALGADADYARRRARNGVALTERVLRLLALTATLEQRNAFEASGVPEVEIDDETLTDELLRMLRAYLGVGGKLSRSRG